MTFPMTLLISTDIFPSTTSVRCNIIYSQSHKSRPQLLNKDTVAFAAFRIFKIFLIVIIKKIAVLLCQRQYLLHFELLLVRYNVVFAIVDTFFELESTFVKLTILIDTGYIRCKWIFILL
jgi:hypothetical protein